MVDLFFGLAWMFILIHPVGVDGVPAILIVGLAFGASHGLVEGLLVLVPFGIFLAIVRDRTDSVSVPVTLRRTCVRRTSSSVKVWSNRRMKGPIAVEALLSFALLSSKAERPSTSRRMSAARSLGLNSRNPSARYS